VYGRRHEWCDLHQLSFSTLEAALTREDFKTFIGGDPSVKVREDEEEVAEAAVGAASQDLEECQHLPRW
jgi:hypothetical protein